MSLLDKKYVLTINLEDSTITYPLNMSFFNTDKNVANIYTKVQYRDDVIKYISKTDAVNYNIKLTVIKPKSNNLKEVQGILTNDFEEDYAIYKFELPSDFTDQVGLVVCEFLITNANEVLTTSSFSYTIKASKVTGLNPEIIPNPDLPVLKQLIEDVKSAQQWISNIDDVKSSEVKTYSSKKIEDIKTKVDEQFNTIMNEKVGNGILASMSDLSQEVKQAMTGGSVAIVGDGAVTQTNLANDIIGKKFIANTYSSFLSATWKNNSDNALSVLENMIKISKAPVKKSWIYTQSILNPRIVNGRKIKIIGKFRINSLTQNSGSTGTFVGFSILNYYGSTTGKRSTFRIVKDTDYSNTIFELTLEDVYDSSAYAYLGIEIENSSGLLTSLDLDILDLHIETIDDTTDFDYENAYGIRFAEHSKKSKEAEVSNIANDVTQSVVDRIKNEVMSNNNLKSKTWNALGDSITYQHLYTDFITEKTGMTCNNFGIGGSTLAVNNTYLQNQSFVERVVNIPDADIWTVFGGVNDAIYRSDLGANLYTTDTSTVYGALVAIVKNILQRPNRPKLILCTPLRCSNASCDYELLKNVRKAIIEVGEYYCVHVVDLYGKSGFNSLNNSETTSDGTHPNLYGTKIYAPKILKEINELTFYEKE